MPPTFTPCNVPGLVQKSSDVQHWRNYVSVKRILPSEKGQDTQRPPSQFVESCLGSFLIHMQYTFVFSHSPLPRTNCNPQCPLRHQKVWSHLKRRENKQPNLHLQKPGSCVSLLPATRSRTRHVRKARPYGGAAHFHVFFHKKHFH